MLDQVRKIARQIPMIGSLGRAYRDWERRRAASEVFTDPDLLVRSMRKKKPGNAMLETKDGLRIAFRQNLFDAFIIREIFLERDYTRNLNVKRGATIVDIGGYIGDFAIYAAHYLDARVYVYEPIAENFAVLKQNIDINNLGNRITAYERAVSDSPEIVLNVQTKSHGEIHVSAYENQAEGKRVIQAVTPAQIFSDNGLDRIDLLKIDCEGGEYAIFPLLTPDLLARVDEIVFEHHPVVPDWRERVDAIFAQLRAAGFTLIERGIVVSGTRSRPTTH